MVWKLSVVLALAMAWLPAPAARADSGSETPECCDYNGLYVGVGGGIALEDFDGGNADDSGYVNARVGYRFLDFLAVEGMGEFMPHFNGKSGRYLSADTSIWSGWLNAKVYPTAHLTGLVQPYLLAGIGGMWGDTKGGLSTNNINDNGFAGRFGLGIDFFLTEHVFLTADAAYLLPAGDAKALDQVLVGGALQYRF